MAEPWMKWAVAEGGTKTASRILQKYVGVAAGSLSGSILNLFVIGLIQTLGGFSAARIRRKKILVSRRQIAGAILFGAIASTMSVLGVFSFTYPGADVGVTTFIITMSIIPGALIDWRFFKHRLHIRQWMGIVVFLGAGYAMLNFPTLAVLFSLPMWVVLTLGIALLAAVQEWITQWQAQRKIEPIDHFVNNFWIGSTSLLLSTFFLVSLGAFRSIAAMALGFWAGAVMIGFIVLCMISFKLLAYKGGGSIALKKLIMQATYLVTATMLGWLVYAEPLTLGKLTGMAGYVVAFTLMDKGTWEYATKAFAACFFKR